MFSRWHPTHSVSALFHLWVELAREVLCHPHAGRAGLELLLVQHTVHLTGLAARRGGAGPADRKTRTNVHWEITPCDG